MARLEWELTAFGRRLRFNLGLSPVKAHPVLERIDGVRYELDTEAHKAAVARLEAKQAEDAEAAKIAAASTAEALEFERKTVAHLEQELACVESRASLLEAQRDVAVADRQNAIEETRRMTLVMNAHECNAARAS